MSAGKEIVALLVSLASILMGIYCAFAAFGLAVAIQANLWFLVPCLATATSVPIFLVIVPGFIYRWRFGFPQQRRTSHGYLARLRKASPF
jgi:membrane protein YdbS with pleckstrin-like domain